MSKFIVFEGADGSGKSTQLRMLADALTDRGYDVIITREPGGTPLAEELRGVMLSKRDEKIHPDVELMLAFAARRQHIFERIAPALEDNKVVLCDRFIPSTYAYQVIGHGASLRRFYDFSSDCLSDLKDSPHYLVFSLDNKESANRVDDRGNKDRMELESEAFFDRVKSGYDDYFNRMRKLEPQSVSMVDASGTIDEVFQVVLDKALTALESEHRFNHPGFAPGAFIS